MPSEQEIEKFMLDNALWRGGVEVRLEAMEGLLQKVDGTISNINQKISMAHGGWIALMAVIGLFASVVGVAVGLYKLFSKGV